MIFRVIPAIRNQLVFFVEFFEVGGEFERLGDGVAVKLDSERSLYFIDMLSGNFLRIDTYSFGIFSIIESKFGIFSRPQSICSSTYSTDASV